MSHRLFISLVGIGCLGAAVLLLNGCASETAPVTAESSRFRPAEESGTGGEATSPSIPTDSSEPGSARTTPDSGTASQGLRPGGGVLAKSAAGEGAATGGDPIPVPDGDVNQLAEFVDKMGKQEPQGQTERELIANFVRNQDARLEALAKIFDQQPDDETMGRALQVAMQIFGKMSELEIAGTRDRIQTFASRLAGNKDKEIARLGRFLRFNSDINDLVGKSPDDGKEIVARVKQFVADEKPDLGIPALSQVDSVAGVLLKLGLQSDALAVMAMGADAAAAHSDPAIAKEQHHFRDKAALTELDWQALARNVLTGEPAAETKLVEKFKETLAKVQPSAIVAQQVQEVTSLLERTGHVATALALNDQLKALFEKDLDKRSDDDKKLAELVLGSIENANKRASVVGQPIAIEGVTREGMPFDWSAYQGKVVLVDFWATWCGPCQDEMPNIIDNYNNFHDRGFEVVGVSLDTSAEDLKTFWELQPLPWTIVTSPEVLDGTVADKERWTDLPMAKKFGIDGIPVTMLVGKDGKVDSIHVQGPKLRKRLVELLGDPAGDPATEKPAEEKPVEEKPAEKPAEEKPAEEKSALATPLCVALAMSLLAADEPAAAPAETPAAPPATADDPAINPYSAKPGLSTQQLTDWVLKMLDKPKTIQGRPGFCDAVCEACDRVMQADPPATEVQFIIAVEAKFDTLHKTACRSDDDAAKDADKRLVAFTVQMQDDRRPRIARQVAFFQQERKVLDAVDGPAEKIPDLLKELLDYYTKEKLEAKHLRMASSTVALINKLEDDDQREEHFVSFGGALAKASDRELARYGKKLAKKPAVQESDLVGKPLELAGTTAKGAPFTWQAYRGKVVLVDFWATWCGPCRREMPNVKALHEKNANRGLEVVGVSLDEDLEALAEYLDENEIPWETLAGEGTQDLAERYGVRGIPTMMLVDQEGKIVGVSHSVAPLLPLVEKLLAAPAAARE